MELSSLSRARGPYLVTAITTTATSVCNPGNHSYVITGPVETAKFDMRTHDDTEIRSMKHQIGEDSVGECENAHTRRLMSV